MNEEDVKQQEIIPFLESLGFAREEMEFERNFTVRLGRTEHKVVSAQGRLDILCKQGGRNLLVVEAKAPDVDIGDDDIAQGVSYARLVHPIAPLVLVTNGREQRLVDTITGKVDDAIGDTSRGSALWSKAIEQSDAHALMIREAIRDFVAISPETLGAFGQSQTTGRMECLRGTDIEIEKKYVPGLYVARLEAEARFQAFLASDAKCFGVFGDSGVGKTNLLCHLAECIQGTHLPLFFACHELHDDLASTLHDEFSWFYSQQLELPQLLRMVCSLRDKVQDARIVLFLDAVDEATDENFPADLANFIHRAMEFPCIKLCVSCKTEEWPRFLKQKGVPTRLSQTLFETPSNVSTQPSSDMEGKRESLPGYMLSRFDQRELEQLEDRYRSQFRWSGHLRDTLREACRNGMMLRVVAEVYKGAPLPHDVNQRELFDRYVNAKLDRTGNEGLRRILIVVAQLQWEQQSGARTAVPESLVIDRIRAPVAHGIPRELFAANLLTATAGSGDRYVDFYYSRVRDYLVAVEVLHLPEKPANEFDEIVPLMASRPVGQHALSWYVVTASEEHREVFARHHVARAMMFLDEYNRIIEHHFPKLKESFEPHWKGQVGLALEDSAIGGIGFYSFRPIDDRCQEKVKVICEREEIGQTAAFWSIGAHWMHGKGGGFIRSDPIRAARKEVTEKLTKIVDEGRLYEGASRRLAVEKVQAVLAAHGDALGYERPQDIIVSDISHLLPLDLPELLNKALLGEATSFHANEVLHERLSGQRETGSRDEIRSPSAEQGEDRAEARRRAQRDVEQGVTSWSEAFPGETTLFSVLKSALSQILSEGMLTECLFPAPDVPFPDWLTSLNNS